VEQQVADKLVRTWNRGRGLYALAQPYLEGRRVAELWPSDGGDADQLRALGAAEVFVESPSTPALSFGDGALDVVICPNFIPAGGEGAGDPAELQAAWWKEIARVLSATGWCVLRAPVAGDEGDAGDGDEGEGEAGDAIHGAAVPSPNEVVPAQEQAAGDVTGEGVVDASPALPDTSPVTARREQWRAFMKDAFAAVEVIEEVAFGGVTFRVPGTEDLAIVGDLSPLAAPVEFEVVVCGKSAEALPKLNESLLVPLAGYLDHVEHEATALFQSEGSPFTEALTNEALARAEADQIRADAERMRADASRFRQQAERVRDEARLSAAAARDREAARDATIASLQEAAERQLHRIAEVEAGMAQLATERDEALRRAQAAEESACELEAALRRREWDVAGHERDVERFGGAHPKG
jgi:hypothetical protein